MTTDCIITQARICESGYGVVWLSGSVERAHRVAFFISKGYWPEVVMHTCDNPSCVNPEHLVGGTQTDNNRDRMQKQRNGRIDGQRNGRAKVSDEEAEEIRHTYAAGGISQQSLGFMFGISQTQVSKIVRGDCFKGKTRNSR